jgi:hypothetical protein
MQRCDILQCRIDMEVTVSVQKEMAWGGTASWCYGSSGGGEVGEYVRRNGVEVRYYFGCDSL